MSFTEPLAVSRETLADETQTSGGVSSSGYTRFRYAHGIDEGVGATLRPTHGAWHDGHGEVWCTPGSDGL